MLNFLDKCDLIWRKWSDQSTPSVPKRRDSPDWAQIKHNPNNVLCDPNLHICNQFFVGHSIAMAPRWIPHFLTLEFYWPSPIKRPISTSTPPLPRIPGPLERRLWGFVHIGLRHLSKWYCKWCGIEFYQEHVYQLPFGLLMKWTDRTSLEEAMAMRMVKSSGIPCPTLLSCGEHPDNFRRFSLLMTRLPGYCMMNLDEDFNPEIELPWVFELQECVEAMRCWESPYGSSICSVMKTAIKSTRVPEHVMGPFENEDELHKYLLRPASSHGFSSKEEYEATLVRARELTEKGHPVKFTHGDFKAHNIMVDDDGHLSGFIDWESAGLFQSQCFTSGMASKLTLQNRMVP